MLDFTGVFMRRIFILLLFIVPLVTGCVNVNTNLSINNNKSAELNVVLATTKDTPLLENISVKENYPQFFDNTFKITDKSDKDGINITAEKSVKNLFKEDIDLTSLGFRSNLESGKFVEVKHNFFVTSYNVNMTYDISKQAKRVKLIKEIKKFDDKDSVLKPEYLQKYADKSELVSNSDIGRADFIQNYESNEITQQESKAKPQKEEATEPEKLFNLEDLKSTFTISLPTFASYNNADSVKGHIYVWQIKKDMPTDIKLQYVVYSGFAILFLFAAGVAFLAYIARRIVRHDAHKRIGTNN